jgi:hypothetical protein
MINIRIILFLLSGTLALFLLLRFQGKLETKDTPLAILSLEFANNAERITEVRQAWEASGMTGKAKTNIWIDFLFIPFYAMLFYTLCGTISVRMQGFAAKLGIFLAFGALVAGLLDALENILMLLALNGHYNDFSAWITGALVWSKFALLAMAALYVIPLGARLLLLKAIGLKK